MMENENITKRLVDLIAKNRISSVEVADALNKTGVLEGIGIFNQGHFAVGKVHYVYTHDESNWPLHEQIVDVQEGSVLYVDTFNCDNRAVFGDIVSKYLFLYKRVKAVVVNGFLRDAHRLRKEDYPIWLKGVTPRGCFNKDVSLSDKISDDAKKQKALFEDSIMVCDDSGCTLISKDKVTEETYKKFEFIELQEDIWYFCVDTLKWSTFETICLKNYLKHVEILPNALRDKLKEFNL